MEWKRYTTIKNLKPNVVHSPMCSRSEYLQCKKKEKCKLQLCGDDEKGIAGINAFKILTDEDLDNISKAVDKWRKKEFKKCRKISIEIKITK